VSLVDLVSFAADLAQQGVRLRVGGTRLRCLAAPGVLTDELCREIERRKPDLISLLDRLHDAGEQLTMGAPRPDPIPLSSAQRRFWFLDQVYAGTDNPYIEARALRVSGPLDVDTLDQALRALVQRHEILRTTLHTGDGPDALPHQRVNPSMPFELELWEDPTFASGVIEDVVADTIERTAAAPFDLGVGPLFRVVLVRRSPTDHVLVAVLHHAIGDGWSLGLFIQESAVLYECLRSGSAVEDLSPVGVQYADYAIWEQDWIASARGRRQLDYWLHLQGVEPVQLPTRPVPRFPDEAVPAGHLGAVVAPDLVAGLRHITSASGASLFMALTTAWRTVIRFLGGPGLISIATDVANRRAEVERTIGCFTNHIVLVGPVDEAGTLHALLSAERTLVLDAFHHDGVPYDEVVRSAGIRRPLEGPDPFSQVKLVLQNVPPRQVDLAELTLAPVDVANRFGKGAFLTNVIDGEDGLLLVAEYPPDVFEPALVELFFTCVERTLALLVADPDLPIRTVLAELEWTHADLSCRQSADLANSARSMLRQRSSRPSPSRGSALG
jgi:hypothetical protein